MEFRCHPRQKQSSSFVDVQARLVYKELPDRLDELHDTALDSKIGVANVMM